MSTPFYDLASLVLVPSGYKAQKVYAQKPLTTDGQLTFSRASTATRVGPDGLIEKVRTNLAAYSEQFDNAYWSKSNITVTANSTANPINGATTADTIARSGGVSSFVSRQIAQTGIVTFSVFAKAGSTNEVRLNTFDGSTDRGATYNLTTGAISSVYGSPLFTLAQDFGSGWYRISIAVNAATYANCQVHIDSLNSVIIFGAQLETGDIATDYIATTSAAVSVGPVANVPRLDYLNSSCPRLLLEPQRTNLVTYSEQFNNAAWSKFGSTSVTANTAVSPDGYTNADTINTSGAEVIRQVVTLAASTIYTYSVFVKKTNYDLFGLQNLVNGTGVKSLFNLSTGTVSSQGSGHTASIVSYGNEWYRCIVTFNSGSSTSNIFDLAADGLSPTLRAFYCYGAMAELGAYATSYIGPTLGAAVTRGADACSKTGISSLIGQTEGTIFWELDVKIPTATGLEAIVNIDNGSFGNTMYIYHSPAAAIVAEMYVSGTNQATFSKGSITAGVYKCALAYANNNTAFFVNGVQVGTTDTSCSVPATSRIQMGTTALSFDTSWTKQLLLFKTRLTNAQLAELTTL